MSQKLIFFVKEVIKEKKRVSSEHALLEIEPINFAGSQIKEILIKDLMGLEKRILFLSGDIGWSGALLNDIICLEMKIDNFSVENGQLKIEDEINSESITIPSLENLKEFSLFYQISFSNSCFSCLRVADNKLEDFEINGLFNFSLSEIACQVEQIKFFGVDNNFRAELKKKLLIGEEILNQEEIKPIKITIKKLNNQNSLSWGIDYKDWGNYNKFIILKIENVDPKNIEISAPFSRVEKPTNPLPEKPEKENKDREGTQKPENDNLPENTNDNGENKPEIENLGSDSTSNFPWQYVPFAVVFVALVTVIVIIVYRKKKIYSIFKKSNLES